MSLADLLAGRYGIVLTQGRRNDILRFLNARLLTEDWPLIRTSLEPRLRRWCERRLQLPGIEAGQARNETCASG